MKDRRKLIERCLDDSARQMDALNNNGSAGMMRAVTVASVFVACATAIAAGAIGLAATNALTWPIGAAAIAAAALFYGAAVACVGVALPQSAYMAGSPPGWWMFHTDPLNKATYHQALENQVEEYERKIAFMQDLNSRNHRTYKVAAILGCSAPLLGIAIFCALFLAGA